MRFQEKYLAEIAMCAYKHQGRTVYAGNPSYAGRYIVGGIGTIALTVESPLSPEDILILILDMDEKLHERQDVLPETLGTWVDPVTQLMYIDFGDTYTMLEAAMASARKRKEKYVYDVYTLTCIEVK